MAFSSSVCGMYTFSLKDGECSWFDGGRWKSDEEEQDARAARDPVQEGVFCISPSAKIEETTATRMAEDTMHRRIANRVAEPCSTFVHLRLIIDFRAA